MASYGRIDPEKFRRFFDEQHLLPQHEADLAKSGITREQGLAMGFRSLSDPALVGKVLNWDGPADQLGSCMLIVFRNPDGTICTDYFRAKPDKPRRETKGNRKGRLIKYESRREAPNRAYFPLGVTDVLADPTVPLVLTEGEKKAAKSTLERLPAVGLTGVWGWMVKRERTNKGRPIGEPKLIPDLAGVAWAGREVVIIFDADAAHKPEVKQAETALAGTLVRLGAIVKIVRLPEPAKPEN